MRTSEYNFEWLGEGGLGGRGLGGCGLGEGGLGEGGLGGHRVVLGHFKIVLHFLTH